MHAQRMVSQLKLLPTLSHYVHIILMALCFKSAPLDIVLSKPVTIWMIKTIAVFGISAHYLTVRKFNDQWHHTLFSAATTFCTECCCQHCTLNQEPQTVVNYCQLYFYYMCGSFLKSTTHKSISFRIKREDKMKGYLDKSMLIWPTIMVTLAWCSTNTLFG